MKYRNKFFMLISLTLVLIMLSLAVSACVTNFYTLSVHNHTDQTLTIYLGHYPRGYVINIGDIEAGAEIRYETLFFDKYSIEAKNARGEVVYSDNFTWDELRDIDWKVVIPPLKD